MNMRRIWSVFDVNLRGFLRDKGGLFFTFLFPVMLMLLFGFIFYETDDAEYSILVQDLDDSDMSRNFTEVLRNVESLDVGTLGPGKDPGSYIKDNTRPSI